MARVTAVIALLGVVVLVVYAAKSASPVIVATAPPTQDVRVIVVTHAVEVTSAPTSTSTPYAYVADYYATMTATALLRTAEAMAVEIAAKMQTPIVVQAPITAQEGQVTCLTISLGCVNATDVP